MSLVSTRRLAVAAIVVIASSCGGTETADSRLLTEPTEPQAPTSSTTDVEPPTSTEASTTRPASSVATTATTTATTTSSTTTSAPSSTTTISPVADNGRVVPVTPTEPAAIALAVEEVTTALLDPDTPAEQLPDLGHREQLLVRSLARRPDIHDDVLGRLSQRTRAVLELHLSARASLGRLHSGWSPVEQIPAWEIIEPEPLDTLIGHYRAAEDATGIRWEILAGINLIETGMGRIDGLSSAGAQGPMQFLPTTWAEVSQGGDIDDPADAIPGAARYLVQRGGLDDIRRGLWGYNNSDHYVDAVLTYAELLEREPLAIRGFYNWEIYVGTVAGTLWLPVGFRAESPISAADWASTRPWAETLPRSG